MFACFMGNTTLQLARYSKVLKGYGDPVGVMRSILAKLIQENALVNFALAKLRYRMRHRVEQRTILILSRESYIKPNTTDHSRISV